MSSDKTQNLYGYIELGIHRYTEVGELKESFFIALDFLVKEYARGICKRGLINGLDCTRDAVCCASP